MEIASLKAQMKSKKLSSRILIFVKDEWEVQKIYIEQLSKVFELEKKRIDAVVDILPSLRTKNISQKCYLYIVRDDKEFMSNEKLQNKVEQNIGNNILIFMLTKLDKRTKFYNKYKDTMVEFETLPDKVLTKYIRQQIPEMSDKNCNVLIEVCEHNYGRILLELDKIKKYHDGHRLPAGGYYDSVFEDLIKSGTIYRPPQDVIFDLVEVIMKRQVKKSFQLLKESYECGEATLVMLTNLFNTAKAVLQVQECQNKEVGKSTGLTGWQIMKAKELRGYYKSSELIKMLHKIQKVESGIKTGKIEDKFAMSYLLTEVL